MSPLEWKRLGLVPSLADHLPCLCVAKLALGVIETKKRRIGVLKYEPSNTVVIEPGNRQDSSHHPLHHIKSLLS